MADGKWISYLRLSTDRQGKSGLGLEGAARPAVADFLNGGRWKLIKEFVRDRERQAATDRHSWRTPWKGLPFARRQAGDREIRPPLARCALPAGPGEGRRRLRCDRLCPMPTPHRRHQMAMVAEEERRMISARTKSALAAAKARGVKLGGPRRKNRWH